MFELIFIIVYYSEEVCKDGQVVRPRLANNIHSVQLVFGLRFRKVISPGFLTFNFITTTSPFLLGQLRY